jgi:hypothetical protein
MKIVSTYSVKDQVKEWFGYRGLYAVLFFTPMLALTIHFITYTGVPLSAATFYSTLLPILLAVLLTALLPGKSGIYPKTLGIYGIWALLAYSLYDWVRVPMNLIFGVPFWDHWFDWGASAIGSTGTLFTYQNLTAGTIQHILQGWGFAMSYYLLVRRVTLLSAAVFASFMTVFYWVTFPVFVLTDAMPPWIWWFQAWMAHVAFMAGLWFAPKIFGWAYSKLYYNRGRRTETGPLKEGGTSDGPLKEGQISDYQRTWKTTLFGVLAVNAFTLMIGFILFGAIVGQQPPSIYPVFGYGKPPPEPIEGLSSFYWAIPAAVIGFVLAYLALRSRRVVPVSSGLKEQR